mmetsp:Transcript_40894/g.123283  ORF Transcript_40894/g.123283 Transcript_40894/m.123283 type:complete len:113 (-) Transcript_40894:41-379(-)
MGGTMDRRPVFPAPGLCWGLDALSREASLVENGRLGFVSTGGTTDSTLHLGDLTRLDSTPTMMMRFPGDTGGSPRSSPWRRRRKALRERGVTVMKREECTIKDEEMIDDVAV